MSRDKKIANPVYILLLYLLYSQNLLAQVNPSKYFVQNLNLENGISQCVITDLAQDQDGFLWIGTFDGLNRYDGYQFKIFRNKPSDTLSLPSSKIYKIFADNHHHLFLRTSNGNCVLNTQTGKIIPNTFLDSLKINWFCKDGMDRIWASTEQNQLLLINSKTLKVLKKSSPLKVKAAGEKLFNIKKNGDKIIGVSNTGNVVIYSTQNNTWQKFENNLAVPFAKYEHFEIDNSGKLYIASVNTDLLEFNLSTKKFKSSRLSSNNIQLLGISNLHFDSIKNTLYMCTYGQGLFIYDINENKLSQYKQNDAKLNLASNYPLCLAKDINDVIWIGYDGRGIDVLDPNIRKFTPIKIENNDDLFALKFVRKIIEGDNDEIWLATAGSGIVKYNLITEEFDFYNSKTLKPDAENFIIEMIRIDQQLLIGFNGLGLAFFDLNKKRISRSIEAGERLDQLSDGTIWSLLKDKEKIWIGTRNNGLNCLDLKTNKITKYTSEKYPFFSENGLRCMYLSKNGKFFIGTEKGLYSFDIENNKFSKLFPLDKKQQNLQSIKCIHQDKKGRLWLGVDGLGVAVLNQKNELIANYNTDNILANNVVYGILPESDHSFWISSNAGLSNIIWNEACFENKSSPVVYHYDAKNGLQSNEFNTGAYAVLSNNKLAFGGIDGINVFNGEMVKPNKVTPKTIITKFTVFNNNLNNKVLVPYLKKVNLKYRENSFALNYNTIGFTLPEKVRYKYQLVGYDKNWIDAENRTYVSYTNLNPGNYEFRVLASNYDGFWSKTYTSLTITIETPFYKTIWFYLLMAITAFLITYLIYRNRIQQIKAKEELKIQYNKEIAEVEMKALRAQINPHFLFNSLNSINNFILKNDNQNARKYLVKFSQLVRNILNNSANPYISLSEELETIELYIQIESMRFDNQFSYTIELDKNLNKNNISIPSLLLQPYIENAIWHGLLHKTGDKNISVRINKINASEFSIEIEDNGIGRAEAEKVRTSSHGKSFGMQLGENRLKLMTSTQGISGFVKVLDMYNEEKKAVGTKIHITLPILENKF